MRRRRPLAMVPQLGVGPVGECPWRFWSDMYSNLEIVFAVGCEERAYPCMVQGHNQFVAPGRDVFVFRRMLPKVFLEEFLDDARHIEVLMITFWVAKFRV